MRRIALSLVLFASIAAAQAERGGSAERGGISQDLWKWANFALLAGVLGYFIYKRGGVFFAGRTADIRRELDESARIKADAEARYAEMERRLAGLGAEIEALSRQAREESAAEAGRVREETERGMAKIRAQAEQDIAAAAKAARQELRAQAAELALGLAERKIRARMTPEVDAALVAGAAHGMAHGAAREARVS